MRREKFGGVALEQCGQFANFVETFPGAAFRVKGGLKLLPLFAWCEIFDRSAGIGHRDNTFMERLFVTVHIEEKGWYRHLALKNRLTADAER